ncbi:mCG141055 [Mus musculus]|nr:mCG141055 [Mus musculus]
MRRTGMDNQNHMSKCLGTQRCELGQAVFLLL